MRTEGIATMEADADAEAEWVAHVNDIAAQTMFMLADSWYLGANIPGKPRVFMPYPAASARTGRSATRSPTPATRASRSPPRNRRRRPSE